MIRWIFNLLGLLRFHPGDLVVNRFSPDSRVRLVVFCNYVEKSWGDSKKRIFEEEWWGIDEKDPDVRLVKVHCGYHWIRIIIPVKGSFLKWYFGPSLVC